MGENSTDLIAQLFMQDSRNKPTMTTAKRASADVPAQKKKEQQEEIKKTNEVTEVVHKSKETQEVRVCKKQSERNRLKGIMCKDCKNVSIM